MADFQSNIPSFSAQPSPVYEFTIRQRAGLQLLGDALQYLSGAQADDREAALLIWGAREALLRAAERRGEASVLPRLRIVWHNQKAGAQ